MDNITYVALSGQTALRRKLDITANNIANLNTVGFKLEKAILQEKPLNAGDRKVSYVLDQGSWTNFQQGTLAASSNPLDIAIEGDAFFSVATPDGNRYTRDGRLSLSVNGTLVTPAGHPILSDSGSPIDIPENTKDIAIAKDGAVVADGNPIANIGMTRFGADGGLVREANGLFLASGQPEPAIGARIHQGVTEHSNVEPMREMIAMMELSKQYDQAKQMIDGADDRTRRAIDRISRPI